MMSDYWVWTLKWWLCCSYVAFMNPFPFPPSDVSPYLESSLHVCLSCCLPYVPRCQRNLLVLTLWCEHHTVMHRLHIRNPSLSPNNPVPVSACHTLAEMGISLRHRVMLSSGILALPDFTRLLVSKISSRKAWFPKPRWRKILHHTDDLRR